MTSARLTELLVLPGEDSLDERRFESSPMRIVSKYLECFDRDGHQVFGVPQYVLEALAERFLSVMNEELNSLDRAFGGSVARQRNSIFIERRDYEIVSDFLEELERAREFLPSHGTPFEQALRIVAAAYKTSEHNVLRIYKKSGRR